MVDAVEKANVPNMVWYNYRRVPAIVMLKQLLDEGCFGRIFHYRSQFLQDWTISRIFRKAEKAFGDSIARLQEAELRGTSGAQYRYGVVAEWANRLKSRQ